MPLAVATEVNRLLRAGASSATWLSLTWNRQRLPARKRITPTSACRT